MTTFDDKDMRERNGLAAGEPILDGAQDVRNEQAGQLGCYVQGEIESHVDQDARDGQAARATQNVQDSQDPAAVPNRRKSLIRSFACAGSGILQTFRAERNMRIHFCFAMLAIVLGFVLRVDSSSWLAIFFCIGLVFAAECFNTAMEAIVDLASPDIHPLAKRAKDCAAAAVLLLALVSVIVAGIVFVPRLLELLI